MTEETEYIADAIRDIMEGNESIIDLSKSVLTDGKERVELVIKKPPLAPLRMESPSRQHLVNSLDTLLKYVNKYGGVDTVILANPDSGVITATLDETAEKGFEVINFHPMIHPLMQPWLDAVIIMESEGDDIEGVLPRDLADFVIAHRREVVAPEAKQLCMLMSQMRISKDIKADVSVANGGKNGLVCTTKFQGVENDVPVELPETITIQCPIYYGRPSRNIEIDLTARIGGDDSCYVMCTSSDLKVKRLEEMEAIIAELIEKTEAGNIIVGLGSINTRDWQYVH